MPKQDQAKIKTPCRLMLTGGGTAGHVMPHVAMLPHYAALGWDVQYIGSAGIEQSLIAGTGLKFYQIAAGKLRRYWSFKNFLDIFKVLLGTLQALWVLRRERPEIVFSKGGFVSVPVAVAARILGIPVISHESDVTPGLANRIISWFSQTILTSFPETSKYVAHGLLAGIPIRDSLKQGSRTEGLRLCGFSDASDLPVLLIMGGSQGAQRINQAVAEILPQLVKNFRIIHITGPGKGINFSGPGYKDFSFVGPELKDLFAATDFAISRAGANSIFELKALKKPMLLIPLESGSRGDQVENARSFAAQGWAAVLSEKALTGESLAAAIVDLADQKELMLQRLRAAAKDDPVSIILAVLVTQFGARSQ